jgi:hypothetical protein
MTISGPFGLGGPVAERLRRFIRAAISAQDPLRQRIAEAALDDGRYRLGTVALDDDSGRADPATLHYVLQIDPAGTGDWVTLVLVRAATLGLTADQIAAEVELLELARGIGIPDDASELDDLDD